MNPAPSLAPFHATRTAAFYQGDCRELMGHLSGWSADLVFADPPYNLSKEGEGMIRGVRPNSPLAGDKGEWDRQSPEVFESLMVGFLDGSRRVLRPGGTIIACCTHHEEDRIKRLIAERFEILNRLIWHKPNPSPLVAKNRLVWSHEYLFVARKPGMRNTLNWDLYPYTEMHDVWHGPLCQGHERLKESYIDSEGKTRQRSLHPTQKPLWLVEKAIRLFSRPGDQVVDPFAGVCTVAVAAEKHGRRSISMDLSSKYLTAGIGRLKG